MEINKDYLSSLRKKYNDYSDYELSRCIATACDNSNEYRLLCPLEVIYYIIFDKFYSNLRQYYSEETNLNFDFESFLHVFYDWIRDDVYILTKGCKSYTQSFARGNNIWDDLKYKFVSFVNDVKNNKIDVNGIKSGKLIYYFNDSNVPYDFELFTHVIAQADYLLTPLDKAILYHALGREIELVYNGHDRFRLTPDEMSKCMQISGFEYFYRSERNKQIIQKLLNNYLCGINNNDENTIIIKYIYDEGREEYCEREYPYAGFFYGLEYENIYFLNCYDEYLRISNEKEEKWREEYNKHPNFQSTLKEKLDLVIALHKFINSRWNIPTDISYKPLNVYQNIEDEVFSQIYNRITFEDYQILLGKR